MNDTIFETKWRRICPVHNILLGLFWKKKNLSEKFSATESHVSVWQPQKAGLKASNLFCVSSSAELRVSSKAILST